MQDGPGPAFELDARLEGDTHAIERLGLCELRLMDDRRWPWLILVPRRIGAREFHEMTPLDQTMLTFETGLVARALKEATGAAKINIATLGNVVSMFHLHVIARDPGDPNWPGPVWGHGKREPYVGAEAEAFRERIRGRLMPG